MRKKCLQNTTCTYCKHFDLLLSKLVERTDLLPSTIVRPQPPPLFSEPLLDNCTAFRVSSNICTINTRHLCLEDLWIGHVCSLHFHQEGTGKCYCTKMFDHKSCVLYNSMKTPFSISSFRHVNDETFKTKCLFMVVVCCLTSQLT